MIKRLKCDAKITMTREFFGFFSQQIQNTNKNKKQIKAVTMVLFGLFGRGKFLEPACVGSALASTPDTHNRKIPR